MNRFISKENLSHFCTTNEKYLVGEIRKLVVEFPGLDGNSCLGGNFNLTESDSPFAKVLGENGILHVYVFTGPWNWMKDTSVITVDHIIDSVLDKYSLNEEIPIVAAGGSMGGHGALMYTLKGAYRMTACAVSCPVCDLLALSKMEDYHFFCATVYYALADREGDFEEIAKAYSPLYHVEEMPGIPYFMIACDADNVVPCRDHAYPFRERMEQCGHDIRVLTAEGKGHCEHTQEVFEKFVDFIIRSEK